VLQRIESRNAIETAHRALQTSGQVFRYAEATGCVERDISQTLKGALSIATAGHFSSMTEPDQAAQLLRAIDSYSGTNSFNCIIKIYKINIINLIFQFSINDFIFLRIRL
jgi:hypothetical protein